MTKVQYLVGACMLSLKREISHSPGCAQTWFNCSFRAILKFVETEPIPRRIHFISFASNFKSGCASVNERQHAQARSPKVRVLVCVRESVSARAQEFVREGVSTRVHAQGPIFTRIKREHIALCIHDLGDQLIFWSICQGI